MSKVTVPAARPLPEFGSVIEWLEYGVAAGFCLEPACATHDGIPYLDDAEYQEWEDGGDPCQHILRLVD